MGRTPERRDRPRADPLVHVLAGERSQRRHQPLAEQQHRGPGADPVGERADRGRQRRRRHGQADQIEAGDLDVGGALDRDRVGERDPGQVGVLAVGGDRGRLLGGPAAELDLDAAAGQQHCDRGAPAAGADHGRLAHRRQAPEPFPLQLDVRPDPRRHGRRQRRRRVLGPREGQRLAGSHPHLARADLPAVADALGPVHGDRHDRRARLQRQPADAAVGNGERAASDPRPLGEDAEDAAALEDPAGRLERLAVRLPPANRIGAEAIEDPALPGRLEQLDLGDVVHRPSPGEHRPEHERVQEAAVIGGDDQAAVDARVLLAEPLEPEPDQEGRLQEEPGDEVDDPVDALRPRVVVIGADPVGADPVGGAGLRRPPRLLLLGLRIHAGRPCISLVGHREAVHGPPPSVTGRDRRCPYSGAGPPE